MMAIDERRARTPQWRNALTWTAAGFVVLSLLALVAAALIEDGPRNATPDVGAIFVKMVLPMLAAGAVVGLSNRKVPFTPRSLVNFVLLSALAIAVFLLARWWLVDAVSLSAIGVSAAVALILGLVLLGFAVLGLVLAAAAHARLSIQPTEQVEAILDQGRVLPMSCIVMAAMGLVLVLLGLAAPGGPLSPGVALAGVVVLLAIETALTFVIWRRIDELSQTLSRETGNAAYYLIVVLGGGWAIFAHLGFVPAPAPLDWLTLLTVIMFVASVIVVARRGLFQPD